MPPEITFSTFSGSAADQVWHDITALFIECFSVAPYDENPDDLATIGQWGPEKLQGEGRLITARSGGTLIGFALGHGLRDDAPWRNILSEVATGDGTARAVVTPPEHSFIVHELAVRESHRGRGIAGACLERLLRGRPESRTFVGVYRRAVDAAAMYRHWGFADIGSVPMPGDAIALHVLAAPTEVMAVRRPTSSEARTHF